MAAGVDMSADLHAFPDHQVMRSCLAGIENRRRTRKQAVDALAGDPGWMPVAVDPEENLLYFVHVAERALSRWQFVYSIEALAANNPSLQSFSVDFDVLEDLQPL